MTVIIHPVGNGDLGNDIVDLNSKERLTVQAERLRELQEIIDEADPEDLAAALLKVILGVSWVISGGRYGDGPLPWGIMGV